MHLGVWSVSTDCFTRPALRRRHCLDRYQGLLGVLGSRVLQKEVVEESECTGGISGMVAEGQERQWKFGALPIRSFL